MSWFNRKKMNEKDLNNEELLEEIMGETEDEFPVNDKRRFNTEGESVRVEVGGEDEKPKQNVKSQRETELENRAEGRNRQARSRRSQAGRRAGEI